ncbi:MAG: tetratricopeptide repeat protein, partial [Acidobacteria bacterium]|nr:tetratricopeptide repeat protein [Acidobacteriota bacterium]
MTSEPSGQDLGRFHVLRQLGVGGMGTVLLAEDTHLERRVALKTITGPDETPAVRDQLKREARAAAALSHPNIAAVHDVVVFRGRVAIVLEYVEGETLAAVLARGPLELNTAVDVACQLASALVAAHDHGIVHRDLKPANIILDATGHAKVLDFGIARFVKPDATAASTVVTTAGALVGTPGYAAPEQWLGRPIDARADIYALGVVLFEMITGKRPFGESEPTAIAWDALQRDAPRVRTRARRIPRELDRLVSATLARNPDTRPQTAREVQRTLSQIHQELTGTSHVGAQNGRPVTRTRAWAAAAATLVLVALSGFGAWSVWTPSPPPRLPVVAVLPSYAPQSDPSKEFLTAGVAESLITRLASLSSVTVLSRAAVADAQTRQPDLRSLARDLDAAYLVETGVQQAGNTLRVTLNLVRRDGSVEWSGHFFGEFEDIFDLQSRLAAALSEALVARISPADRQRLAEQPTSSPDALAAYWQGRALLERQGVSRNLDESIRAFELAIDHDPQFADAHAALGEAFWAQWVKTRDGRWAERATESGMRASQLSPDRPGVRYSLALTLLESGRISESIAELQRALVLRPNYEDARLLLGRALVRAGNVDEGVVEFRQAIDLRPNHAGSYTTMGLSLYEAGRDREAIAAFEHVLRLQPDNPLAFQQIGTAYQRLGDDTQALANYERALRIRPVPQVYSNIGFFHHRRGEYGKAVEAYTEAIKLRPNSAVTHRNLGDAYARMGRRDEARDSYLTAAKLTEADLKINPHNARLVASLALYLQKSGDREAAQERLGQAMQMTANDFDVLQRAAVIHTLSGQVDLALEALQRAINQGYPRASARAEEEF